MRNSNKVKIFKRFNLKLKKQQTFMPPVKQEKEKCTVVLEIHVLHP